MTRKPKNDVEKVIGEEIITKDGKEVPVEIIKEVPVEILRDVPVEVIKEATRLMKEEKLSIGVYPEGTRNKGEEGTLLEFKDGAFKTALRAKCPIVVSILKNTRAIGKRPHLKPTKIEFIILKVIPYEEYKSMKTNEISALVKEIMYEGLK